MPFDAAGFVQTKLNIVDDIEAIRQATAIPFLDRLFHLRSVPRLDIDFHKEMPNWRKILYLGRALISNPNGWTRGARHSFNGARHCALGALHVAQKAIGASDDSRRIAEGRLMFIIRTQARCDPKHSKTIWHYNDDIGHAAIMLMFDRTIAATDSDVF